MKKLITIEIKWVYYLLMLLLQIPILLFFTGLFSFSRFEYSKIITLYSLSISLPLNLGFIRDILNSIKNNNYSNKNRWIFFVIVFVISLGILFNFYVLGEIVFLCIYLTVIINSLSILFFGYVFFNKKFIKYFIT